MKSEATAPIPPFFVYGTLMIGQANDKLWQNSVLTVSPAVIEGARLYDHGFYPVLIEESNGQVSGQLVHVAEQNYAQILKNLDGLEGFDPRQPDDSEYRRIVRSVRCPDGRKVEAWLYAGSKVFARGLPLIPGGDWAKHVCGREEELSAWWKTTGSVRADRRRIDSPGH